MMCFHLNVYLYQLLIIWKFHIWIQHTLMIFSYKSNIDTSQLKQEKDFCTSRKAKHLPMLFYQVFLNRISIQKQTFSLQWCEMLQNILQYGKTLYATPASHIIQSNTIKPKQKTHFILSISYFVTMALFMAIYVK